MLAALGTVDRIGEVFDLLVVVVEGAVAAARVVLDQQRVGSVEG
jgi:hypothetical protein